MAKEAEKHKKTGRIYTPDYIVNNILELSGYFGNSVLRRHVIDNSCGDGAFLTEIVKRYCEISLGNGYGKDAIRHELGEFVHGIEINERECEKCISNVTAVAQSFGVENVKWDIQCADALSVKKYDGKMDYVLGNPPYIRVHNLGDSIQNIKQFSFAQSGMTDLFIVFYEIGLKMLNETGILGYITPSSFYNSIAGNYMRNFIVRHNLFDKVVNLKHFQAFSSTTYTTIVILSKSRKTRDIEYFEYDGESLSPELIDTLSADDFYISGNFYFSTKDKLRDLKNILYYNPSRCAFSVKNGFATLADSFFIGDFDFDDYTIPVVKASTGGFSKCLFPYKNGKLVDYEELTRCSKIKDYYASHIELLKKRSLETESKWYGFGRTQGINDVCKCKYAINTLIRNINDIKLIKCDAGTGVYSGLYILTQLEESELRSLLFTNDFVSYISLLGKYKSGGYYTFSSIDLKKYLEYKNSQIEGICNG